MSNLWQLFLAESLLRRLAIASAAGLGAFTLLLVLGYLVGSRLRIVRDMEAWADVLFPSEETPEERAAQAQIIAMIRANRAARAKADIVDIRQGRVG